jgi:hypothetical protein
MADDGDAVRIDLGERPEESETRADIAELIGLE